MKQGLLSWSPTNHALYPLSLTFPTSLSKRNHLPICATPESPSTQQQQQQLTAKEKRQLRNERRESKAAYNWKEEVEERLIKKPKKRYASWTEELNLDNLAISGHEWWVVRVSRIKGQETAVILARSLARNYPDIGFKIYAPAVQVKRKLKNGSISIKPKPLFPGCIFLRCILNKEIHDFVKDFDGVGGFIGSRVGNTKRQITLPRAVSEEDMEAIFRQAKVEQEKSDQAFEHEQQEEETRKSQELDINSKVEDSSTVAKSGSDSKPKRRTKKTSDSLANDKKLLPPGSNVRVLSGTFAEFVGSVKKVNRKTGKVTVGFTLFGKESLVDLELNEVVPDTN